MLDALEFLPLPTLRGERVILRRWRDSDVDDRLAHPIDPEEEDNYGSSWRREWDGRRYHTREDLTAQAPSPDTIGSYHWAIEYDGHCVGHAGLRFPPGRHPPGSRVVPGRLEGLHRDGDTPLRSGGGLTGAASEPDVASQ